MSVDEIFRFVGKLVIWGLAIILGLTVFTTLAGGIIAFASTGLGAIILILLAYKIWKDLRNE